MQSLIPHEVRMGPQVDFDLHKGSCQRLHVCFKLKAWEPVDLIQHSLAHLREINNLANLLGTHLIKVMPLELCLFLYFTSDVVKMHDLRELP